MSASAATAEHPLAALAREPALAQAPPVTAGAPRGPIALGTLAVAGLLCFATFVAGGGLSLAPMTTVEMTLTVGAGAIVAICLLLAPGGARAWGAWSVGLLLAMTVLTALSVAWSVGPDSSWQDAGRMLAYGGVLAAAVALARVAPRGWPALLGGVVLAAVVVCGYALLTKVLPDRPDAGEVYARLQEPYGYWNAIGLTAAMGAIGCMWLGARRAGHGLLSAMAYPAMGLSLVTLMLAYSRGALAALAVGVAVWLWIVPLRLRGARVLIVGALGAAPVVAFAFTKHALSHDGVALAARTSAGHQLGALLAAMLIVLGVAGVAIGFFGDRRAPSLASRRLTGALLVALLALALGGLGGALAVSKRGLEGTISHDFRSLTDPNAPVPSNTPGRLAAIGSVRARYWNEALKVFKAHPALGVGASGYETARLRYREETLDVRHAHGFVVQTLADLGIVGLALALALLAAWLAAAGRSARPLNRRLQARRAPLKIAWRRAPAAYTPERIGLESMLCVVVAFGVHSFADWTWYVPGNACVALLCAGWLAGRGPLGAGNPRAVAGTPAAAVPAVASANGRATPRAPSDADGASGARPLPRRLGPVRADVRSVGLAAAVLAVALAAAWTQWQPQRSVESSEQALALLARDPVAARAAAQSAVNRDPLSAQALFTLSAVQHATGESALARATLQKAVRLQPGNPQTWLALGEYDLAVDPRSAVSELRAAVYLDPESIPTQNAYVQALRANPPTAGTGGTTPTIGAPGATVATGRSPAAGGRARTARAAQKRRRSALASSTRRAPGKPPAPKTSTPSKP